MFFIALTRSCFYSPISLSLSLSFFFFSCSCLISLSIYSFIIWYKFYYWISSYSMILRKDFSKRSISSLNFFRTLSSSFEYSSSVAGVSYSKVSTSQTISCTIFFISTTKIVIPDGLTFRWAVHHFMFKSGVLEDAFWTEKLLIIFTKKLDFLRCMCAAKTDTCLNVVLTGVVRRRGRSSCLHLLR
jgi:hypothetical protein